MFLRNGQTINREEFGLGIILLEPSSKVLRSLWLLPLIAGALPVRRSDGKPNRVPKGFVRTGVSFPEGRTGAIRFRHKRLFAVSLVGVEAKYVRLPFQVEVPDGDTKNDFSADHPRRDETGRLTSSPCRERSLRPARRPRRQRADHKPFALRSTSWREPPRVDLPSRASRFCGR